MAKAKAEDILQKLKAGADFGKLAAQYSDDPGTRDKGGDLGYFNRGEMVKPFEDAAFKLKPGQMEIVESQFGYHVIRVEDIKAPHVDSINDARAVSKEELDRRKFAVQIQEAKLAQAQADVQSAAAQVQATETEISRRLVRAPVDGQLLQVKEVKLRRLAESSISTWL